MRVLIISQPKAGSYLCVNLLEEMEFNQTGLHIADHLYKKYRLNHIQFSRNRELRCQVKKPINESVNLIQDNEIAVTHVLPTKHNIKLFKPFRKIFLYRNYEERMESWGRWFEITNSERKHDDYHMSKNYHNAMFNWTNVSDVFRMSFNDMIDVNISKLNLLQSFLFGDLLYDSGEVMSNAISKNSLTKSKIYS